MCGGQLLLVILTMKKLLGRIMEKNFKKKNQKECTKSTKEKRQ